MDDKHPPTFFLRGMAGMAGLLLALVSASAWLAADRLLWALNQGGELADDTQRTVERSLDASSANQEELVAAHAALTGVAYSVDHFLGNVISATKQFEWLVALALLAGLVSAVVACLRRPREIWPEWVWLACAIVALAPAIAAGWWLAPGFPLAATIALAALLHLLRRRDFTLSRGAAAVAPHAQRMVERGTPVGKAAKDRAGRALERGAPAARAALDKGAPAARKAFARGDAASRAALSRLPRRRRAETGRPPWALPPSPSEPGTPPPPATTPAPTTPGRPPDHGAASAPAAPVSSPGPANPVPPREP